MNCPTMKEIEETQVYKVIETGDTAYKIMSKLLRDFGDMWKEGETRRLDNAMRRLAKKDMIYFNRRGREWVKARG